MSRARPAVSLLVPVYNEEATVDRVLAALVRLPLRAEIVAVDDGSTDGSAAILARWAGRRGVRVLRHRRNRGKGAAVLTALAVARGRVAVFQDADLETSPSDIPRLLRALAARGDRAAVSGTRFPAGRPRTWAWTTAVANRILTGAVNRLYGAALTDVACAYKAAPVRLLRRLGLRARRFELEAELTARLLARGIALVEVPIRYRPRGYREGKKIHPLDGLRILAWLLRLRFGRGLQ